MDQTGMILKGKKVTVVGLARSGVAVSNLLSSLGAKVIATDTKGPDELTGSIGRLERSVHLSLGGHPDIIFLEPDFIVVSPGVPMDIMPLNLARERGIPIISELELSYLISDIPFIAITGTNGKSTTTTLVDLILGKAELKTILGGNIGKALTEEIQKIVVSQQSSVNSQKTIDYGLSTVDYVVAEVSSFQLEGIDTFRPKIASILNITSDHLDRYKSFNDYTNAKARIFENQKEGDFLVLNADDPETVRLCGSRLTGNNPDLPEVFFFSRKKAVEGVYLRDGIIYCNFPKLPLITCPLPLIDSDEIGIKGVHNLENAMAATAIALLAGCNLGAIRETLAGFKGLEHRLEFVEEIRDVRFINDSKGTNVGALLKSLESLNSPVILIAGGLDKDSDFTPLRGAVTEKVKSLILIGKAKDKIAEALNDCTEISYASTMDDAVFLAFEKATAGSTILLSPACASFDMFRDFEDRGRKFKEAVRRLKDA
ncbi:MAG: UDP-N-acetylmuramoyl-L-alanine--D-glutamate ligase [Nitrospirota bacterium]